MSKFLKKHITPKYYLYIFIVFYGFVGCNNSEKIKIKDRLSIYMGREIILPIVKDSNSGKIKIVTAINGDCGVCVDDLKKWKNFKEQTPMSMEYYIYVYTEDSANLAYMESLIQDLDFPIVHDKEKSYLSQNNLMDEPKLFQTFLLDQSNKVVVVGNPIYNIKLDQLYRREIQRLITKNVE